MDEDLYDEFGNYVGPELEEETREEPVVQEDEEESISEEWADDLRPRDENDAQELVSMRIDREKVRTQIVLHEDKKYYPTAGEVYGDEVEALVQEEDTQALTEPTIAPIRTQKYVISESNVPETRYQKEFLVDLMDHPSLIRNVAIVGHLHHGKTLFMDMLVRDTHMMGWDIEKEIGYTDTTVVERQRGISIKATPMSLVMQDLRGKSHLMNIMDCPGHADFLDEVAGAFRLADGVVLIVDAVEGVMLQTEQLIKCVIKEELPLTLVINKLDRLILELKLPPADAYHKLRHTIEEVNALIRNFAGSRAENYILSPERSNVCFSSSLHGYCFSLHSFARMFISRQSRKAATSLSIDSKELARRLWGDIYFDPSTRQFASRPADRSAKRTFVEFVLEPLYKLYAHVVGEDETTLKDCLSELGIYLLPAQLTWDVKPLLKLALSMFFGSPVGFSDMVVHCLPSPIQGARRLVDRTYTGPLNESTGKSLLMCDKNTGVIVYVAKLSMSTDGKRFDALGRVMAGTLRKAQPVKVLGETYSPEENEEEDMTIREATALWILEARYRIEIMHASVGNWVAISGVDASISKTATIVDVDVESPHIFRPLQFPIRSVVRLGIEPLHPNELPKMVEALRQASKSYAMLRTSVEESGEHVIVGPGEMYLDCVMHDVRTVFAQIEIKVSDPVTVFSETVVDTSAIKCFTETPNHKNRLTMIAEPMEKGLAEAIEAGELSFPSSATSNSKLSSDDSQIVETLQSRFQWDPLAARSLWAFGPNGECGPNVLVNDTLASSSTADERRRLQSVRESIRQGFQWATREGPLCDEPMRNVKFRLLDATLASDPISRGSGQLIPTARRVCYSAFLTATPRLMEPVYAVEIQAPADCVAAVYTVLARRRGHVTNDVPKAGTPLYTIKALLPVMDSFGFEVDLRTHTQGQAFCQQVFDHWQLVPGDPLDKSIVLRPLEPSPAQHLARDFMVKTRRRKGLGDEVVFGKYFDEAMLVSLAARGLNGI